MQPPDRYYYYISSGDSNVCIILVPREDLCSFTNANMENSTEFEDFYESNYRKLEQASDEHVENLEYVVQSYIMSQLHDRNSRMDTDMMEVRRYLNSPIVTLQQSDPLVW